MAALAVVTFLCLYLVGQRADRIHAQRTYHRHGPVSEDVRTVADGRGTRKVSIAFRSASEGSTPSRSIPVPARGLYRHHTAAYWAGRYRYRTRQLQQARRVLLSRPSVTEAINLAAVVYGNGSTLWALARCESGLDPHALNPSSSTGLFQILYPSTWSTTPFARFSPWSAYANAMAAGYMVAHGRRSEWVC